MKKKCLRMAARSIPFPAQNPRYTELLLVIKEHFLFEYRETPNLPLRIVDEIIGKVWKRPLEPSERLFIFRFLKNHAVQNIRNIETLIANPNAIICHKFEMEWFSRLYAIANLMRPHIQHLRDGNSIPPEIVAEVSKKYDNTTDNSKRKLHQHRDKMLNYLESQEMAPEEIQEIKNIQTDVIEAEANILHAEIAEAEQNLQELIDLESQVRVELVTRKRRRNEFDLLLANCEDIDIQEGYSLRRQKFN